jgi:ABC-type dipeptide/oligopeptide/nickel transport system permease component
VGRLIVGAVAQRDYMVVQGAIIFYAAFVGIINLLIDIAYPIIDPRIRYE